MLAKINETGSITEYRGYVKKNGKIIANPPPDTLRESGFKPLICDDIPEGMEISDLAVSYRDEGDFIRTVYSKREAE